MTALSHITHIDNLRAILAANALVAYNCLSRDEAHVSLAHRTIQQRRYTQPVPLPPGGTLHDYVPFYFAPRSPMLYAIWRGRVGGYHGGQEPVLHLVTTVERLDESGCAFVFTDGHAIMRLSRYLDDLASLDQIDWDVMRDNYWRDTDDDLDRKRRRQAEFLVHQQVPWPLITEIGVHHEAIQEQVEALLQQATHRPRIRVRRNWYY